MQTLGQFKQENGVTTIDFLQGKGRAFATVNDKSVIIASNADTKKPLFVSRNAELGVYVVCNAEGLKVAGSL